MKRRRHLTKQHPGGLDIQRHRQAPSRWHRYPARAAPPATRPGPPPPVATRRPAPPPPRCAHAPPAATPTGQTTSPSPATPPAARPRCWAQAMLRSSSTIRHDTASMARWWTINTSWPVEATHSALSIAPAAGFNRDRAPTSASSDNTSTACRHPRASTDPASGTCNDHPPAPSSSTRSRNMACRSSNGLQHHHHVGLGHPRGGLHHHRLVELVDRAIDALQPAHDRGGASPARCPHRSRRPHRRPPRPPGPAGPRSARRKYRAADTAARRPAPAPPPASTKCCPHPARRTSRRPRPARAPAPGRRCRPGSPRPRWPGRGTDRHRCIPVPAGRGCRVCR